MTPDDPTATFDALRPRLYGIAYRMLGTRADAEDVLQDAWLRWQAEDREALRTPEAWLVTVVSRLAIDRLRSAKAEREAYASEWLPEPIVAWDDDTPETLVGRAPGRRQRRPQGRARDAGARPARVVGDSGGKVPEVRGGIRTGERMANLLLANFLRFGPRIQWRIARINGEPGLLRYIDGRIEAAQAIQTDGERIVAIYTVGNPDKLVQLGEVFVH